ncbi:MAG: winged helix-turn-helix domain-containing protein [Parasphingopyxis sp.]
MAIVVLALSVLCGQISAMDVARFELGSDRLRINLLHRRVRYDGKPISLCPRELDLLVHLVLRCPVIVSRAELLRHVCKLSIDPGTNVIDVHLCRLRSKLKEAGAAPLIETVRGQGYRLAISHRD